MIWRDTGGVGRGGKRFPAKGTLPALPRRQRMTASRAAAVSFNQDGGFSFFRAKERESPQKRERKPGASDTAKAATASAPAVRKSAVLFRLPLPSASARNADGSALHFHRPCLVSNPAGVSQKMHAPTKCCAMPCGEGNHAVVLSGLYKLSFKPEASLPSPLGRVPSRHRHSGMVTA